MQHPAVERLIWKEHIRLRPAMYIGNLQLEGFKQMLEYLFEDILKDCLENPVLDIYFYPENTFVIGIANIDTKKFVSQLNELKTTNQTMTSVGLSVLISLSAAFSVQAHGQSVWDSPEWKESDVDVITILSQKKETGIVICYKADKYIFKDFELKYEHINNFLDRFTLLNPGLKIISTDKTTAELQRNIFYSPTGIFKKLDYLIAQWSYGTSLMRIDIDAHSGNYSYKIGISYSGMWPDKSIIETYAENIETYMGGSLNDGILEGLTAAIRVLAEKEKLAILINRKLVKEQLTVIAAVRGADFNFEGSIRRKLGMPKLKAAVKTLVIERLTDYFNSNPAMAENILYKFKRWE